MSEKALGVIGFLKKHCSKAGSFRLSLFVLMTIAFLCVISRLPVRAAFADKSFANEQ